MDSMLLKVKFESARLLILLCIALNNSTRSAIISYLSSRHSASSTYLISFYARASLDCLLYSVRLTHFIQGISNLIKKISSEMSHKGYENKRDEVVPSIEGYDDTGYGHRKEETDGFDESGNENGNDKLNPPNEGGHISGKNEANEANSPSERYELGRDGRLTSELARLALLKKNTQSVFGT